MPDYFRVVKVEPGFICGGNQGWVRLVHRGDRSIEYETVGCICHTTLPHDARVIGMYLDRPYPDDPMPLFDEAARVLWKRRNAIRRLGTDAYRRPPDL